MRGQGMVMNNGTLNLEMNTEKIGSKEEKNGIENGATDPEIMNWKDIMTGREIDGKDMMITEMIDGDLQGEYHHQEKMNDLNLTDGDDKKSGNTQSIEMEGHYHQGIEEIQSMIDLTMDERKSMRDMVEHHHPMTGMNMKEEYQEMMNGGIVSWQI